MLSVKGLALGIAMCSLASLSTPRLAQAACTTDGDALIRLPAHTTIAAPQSVPDAAGGAFIVWSDNRTGNYDVYISRFQEDCQLAPGWPTPGTYVCTAPGHQRNPKVVPDGSGGVYIVWEDERNGTDKDLFAQRITSSGAIAAGWPLDGVPVVAVGGNQTPFDIAVDGSAGLLVAWLHDVGNPSQNYVFAQKIAAADGAQIWTPSGGINVSYPIASGSVNGGLPRIVPTGSGGAIIGWPNLGTANSSFRKLSSSGAQQWVSTTTLPAVQMVMLPTASGGAQVAAYRLAGASSDIYYDIIASDGTVPTEIGVCTATGNQTTPRMVADATGGVVIAWIDQRTAATEVYASRIVDGAILNEPGTCSWQPGSGVAVATGSGTRTGLVLAADGLGGGALAWQEGNDIKARQVRANALLGSPVTVCGATGTQSSPTIVLTSLGHAFSAFLDPRLPAENAIFGNHIAVSAVRPPALSSLTLLGSGPSTIAVTWSFPSPDPVYGPATAFDVRVSSQPITEDNFAQATLIGISYGMCAAAEGLNTCQPYYVALRTRYGCHFWSSVSNNVSAATSCSGGFDVACGIPNRLPPTDATEAPPREVEFGSPSPNPSHGGFQLDFGIPEHARGSQLELAIFDLLGRRVRVLEKAAATPGRFHIVWDGRGEAGKLVRSGVYYARLTILDKRITRMLTLTP